MSSLDVGVVSGALEMRDAATAVIRRVGDSLGLLEKQFAAAEAASARADFSKALSALTTKAMVVGGVLTAGVTVPLLGLARSTGQVAAEFEKTMVKLVTLAGVGEQEMVAWRDSVLDMAGDVGVGPNELAKALYNVTSAGLRSAEALEVVRHSAKASAVGLGDVDTIARAVTATMAAYASTGMTAERATDVLTATVREGSMEASELAGTLGRVVGIAATVGVSFEEVGSYLATFSRLGINSAEAVTALRGTLNTFLKTGDEARRTLEAYGLSIEEVRRVIKEDGLAAALGLLVDTFKGNEDALSRVIPNVRALAGILGTAGAQGQSYRDVLKQLEASHRTTAEGFERTSKTMAFGWAQLKAETEALAVKYGDRLAPAMREVKDATVPILDGLGRLVDGFAKLPEPVQQATLAVLLLAGPLTFLGGLATKAGVLLAGAFKFLSAGLRGVLTGPGSFIAFDSAMKMTGASIGALMRWVLGLVGLFGGLGAAVWKASQSQSEWVRTIAAGAGPFGALAVGWRNFRTYVLDAGVALDTVAAKLNKFKIAQQKALAAREFKAPTFEEGQRNLQEMLQAQLRPKTGTREWAEELQAAREELARLAPATRAAMESFYEVHGSVDKVKERFGLSTNAAALFVKQLQETAAGGKKALKELSEEAQELERAVGELAGGDRLKEMERTLRVLRTGVAGAIAPEDYEKVLDSLLQGYAQLVRQGQPVSDELLAWIDYFQQLILSSTTLEGIFESWRRSLEEVVIAGRDMRDILGDGWGAGAGSSFPSSTRPTGKKGGLTRDDLIKRGYWSPEEWERAGEESAKSFMDGWESFDWTRITDSLLRALEGGGNVFAAVATALGTELMRAFEGSESTGGKVAAGVGAGLVAGIQGASVTVARESKAMGALAGGLAGAAMGAQVAGPIGAAVGGAIGLIGGLFGDAGKKARELRQQLVANAGGIDKLRKAADWAGVSMNAFLNAKKAKDVQAAFDKITAAIEATRERLEALVEDLDRVAERGDLLSMDLIRRLMADRSKEEVQAALDAFMRNETQRAASGLAAFLTVRPEYQRGLEEARGRVEALAEQEQDLLERMRELEERDHLTPEQARQLGELQTQLAEVRSELAGAQGAVDRFGTALASLTLSPATASALQAGLVGVFGDLLAQGASPVDALKQLDPAIQSLQGQMKALGINASPAFEEIARMASLARDAVAGPLLSAVAGLGQGLVGLHNTGLLTADMFSGLARGAYDAFHTLELQGKGGTDAVRAMQPTLQRIWELQQDFGYEVDESTQKLLDFARESGLIGDKFRPSSDKMTLALDALVGRFDRLIDLFARLLPGAAEDGTEEINAALRRIDFEGVARRGVDAFADIEEAATATAWGHSPTGIKEIPIATEEALAKLREFGAYATQMFASVEDMAAYYARATVAGADGLGRTIQTLSQELEDLVATPLQRTLNGIERDLMRTLEGMQGFVDDPRYEMARQLAEQIAELRGREAVWEQRNREAAEAQRAAGSGGDARIEQILVVHLDGQVLTQAAIKGLPEKIKVLAR